MTVLSGLCGGYSFRDPNSLSRSCILCSQIFVQTLSFVLYLNCQIMLECIVYMHIVTMITICILEFGARTLWFLPYPRYHLDGVGFVDNFQLQPGTPFIWVQKTYKTTVIFNSHRGVQFAKGRWTLVRLQLEGLTMREWEISVRRFRNFACPTKSMSFCH